MSFLEQLHRLCFDGKIKSSRKNHLKCIAEYVAIAFRDIPQIKPSEAFAMEKVHAETYGLLFENFSFDSDKQDTCCMRCGSGFSYWQLPTGGEESLHCQSCYEYREAAFASDPALREQEAAWMNQRSDDID